MKQLMVFIYKCNAVFALVRQYCVMIIADNRHLNTAELALYSARDGQIVFFPILDVYI